MIRSTTKALACGALLLAALASLPGCGSGAPSYLSESAQKGWKAYRMHCSACHNLNPHKDGAGGTPGPPLAGSSLELLRLRTLEGRYPKGYKPKRATANMVPVPQAEPHLKDIHAFLSEAKNQ